MQIEKLARELEPYLMDKRRYFHRHPELSWQETATTEALAEELNAMGLEVRRFPGHTGVMGVLRGKAPCAAPKTLLLRADIDALPIAEKTGLPYQSETGGVMHACGHDGHTAMLLGAARLLCGLTEQFSGEIRFLFQSAEETSAGAVYYIEQGVTAGADAVFGMHLWGDFDAPWLDVSPGPRMASCDRFQITVRGVSAHGSAPQQGVDAVVAASALVMQLQTLVSRGTDPRDALVVTVGKISGGKRFNIIADQVELVGTVRAHRQAVRAAAEKGIRRMSEHTAAAYGATADVIYTRMAAAVVNDPALARMARQSAVRLYGESALHPMEPTMASEDFAFYLEQIPGVYGFIGVRNVEKGIDAPNHSDRFTIDENVLQRGTALYAQFALDFLLGEAVGAAEASGDV